MSKVILLPEDGVPVIVITSPDSGIFFISCPEQNRLSYGITCIPTVKYTFKCLESWSILNFDFWIEYIIKIVFKIKINK